MKTKRAVLIILDSLGIGNAPDAVKYGDRGANTLKSVMMLSPDLPNLVDLGLLNAAKLPGAIDDPLGCYGSMTELSAGKDTTTGHWELAGLPVMNPFPTYPDGFPKALIEEFEAEVGLGVIGNVAASGTEIIERLGSEHLRTGKLIVYTSSDSVFQIAAHEAIIPATELWHICRIARRMLTGEHGVARVIARPFIGSPGEFVRTDNRRDFSLDPTGKTMLDLIKASGKDVIGVGKLEDIFNHRGLTKSDHTAGNAACIDSIVEYLKQGRWKGLLFANLVDFDMLYGHRRDTIGYAKALEEFDRRLPEIMRLLGDDGLLIITADHGCDPAFKGTDHTREQVPLLTWSLNALEGVDLGDRRSFADVSATILESLGIKEKLAGKSFLGEIEDN